MTLIFERSFEKFSWSVRKILFGFAKYSFVFAKLKFGSPTKIEFANSKFDQLKSIDQN